MDTLLSVLMYLGTIAPGQTYDASFINQQVTMMAPIITSVKRTPPQIQQAMQIFGPLAPTIIIINEDDNEITQSN